MHSSSLQFNSIMSSNSKTTHTLIKINLHPLRNLAHACHMITARWNCIFREWEIANNDGKWVSTKRVMLNDQEKDEILGLIRNLEEAYSVTLYYFKEVAEPIKRLRHVTDALELDPDLTKAMFHINNGNPDAKKYKKKSKGFR